MFVALDAFKHPKIARHDVTFQAFTPFLVVGSGEYRKKSVVIGHIRGSPACHFVAVLANCRKATGEVVR
jgi:hypothetical protein